MENEKKVKSEVLEVAKTPKEKSKKHYRDVDFLTEVLACIAWTTKG